MWQMNMPKYPTMNKGFLLNQRTMKTPAIIPNKLITPMMIVPVRGVMLPPVVILDRIVLEKSIMTLIPINCLIKTCTVFTQLALKYLAFVQKASLRVTRLVSFWMVD